VVGYVKS